jgi:hypothetical protein
VNFGRSHGRNVPAAGFTAGSRLDGYIATRLGKLADGYTESIMWRAGLGQDGGTLDDKQRTRLRQLQWTPPGNSYRSKRA